MTKNERLIVLQLTKQSIRLATILGNISESLQNEELRATCTAEVKVTLDEFGDLVTMMDKEWGPHGQS